VDNFGGTMGARGLPKWEDDDPSRGDLVLVGRVLDVLRRLATLEELTMEEVMRYRQGYPDGSGQDQIVDTTTGKTVAVTRWGCSCCAPDISERHLDQAAAIVAALNRGE
jgi:hypothetical protein